MCCNGVEIVWQEISALLCGFAAEAGISEEDLEGELATLLEAEQQGDVANQLPDVPVEAVVDTLPEVVEGECSNSRGFVSTL